MWYLDQDPISTLSQNTQHGMKHRHTEWLQGRGKNLVTTRYAPGNTSQEGAAWVPASNEFLALPKLSAEPRVYCGTGRVGLWYSTQGSGWVKTKGTGSLLRSRVEKGSILEFLCKSKHIWDGLKTFIKENGMRLDEKLVSLKLEDGMVKKKNTPQKNLWK